MKTYFVLSKEQLGNEKVFEWETRFLQKERAEQYLASSRKWAEEEKNGNEYELVEREEDIEMQGIIGIPKSIFLQYDNGITVNVDVDRAEERLSIGHKYRHIVWCDEDTIKKYNRLNELEGDERHIVHDIVLAGFRQFSGGFWRAEYNLVGGIGNSRTAHGNMCDFRTDYEKERRSIVSLTGSFEQMGNLNIYW